MRRLLALLLGTILAVAALGVAEARQRDRERGAFAIVPDLGYAVAADTEGPGWRDDAAPPPREPGVRRVVCVGDSVTAGVGVAPGEAWPERLRALLGRGRTEVYNFGVAGWDAAQVATLLETRIAAWAPDLVIWGTYANDVFPTRLVVARESGDAVYVGGDVPAGAALLPDTLGLRLLRVSALYRHAQAARYVAWSRGARQVEDPAAVYAAQVARVTAWSGRTGVPTLIVALPPHILAGSCTDPHWCGLVAGWRANQVAGLAASGAPWVDGMAAWEGHGPFPLPGRFDPDHPNEEGHARLAAFLAPLAAERLPETTAAARPPETPATPR